MKCKDVHFYDVKLVIFLTETILEEVLFYSFSYVSHILYACIIISIFLYTALKTSSVLWLTFWIP